MPGSWPAEVNGDVANEAANRDASVAEEAAVAQQNNAQNGVRRYRSAAEVQPPAQLPPSETITQTDRLNKRLLVSFLNRMNSRDSADNSRPEAATTNNDEDDEDESSDDDFEF